MRLSSSSTSAGFYSLLKRNPVASTVLLACVCLLLPLVAGVKEPEIDLKTANHDRDQAGGVSMDAKYARIATSSGQHESAHSRKNKPNKSSFKKYVEDSSVDQHGKEKKSIYDKKYFDYMPVEQKDPLDVPADVSSAKRTNSRRFRRDADGGELRTKRHGPWFPYSVKGYPYQVPMILPGSEFVQYVPDSNYRPMLNNHYLPPAGFTPVPQQPDRTYLPSGTQRPQTTEIPGMFDTGNRFGGSDGPVFAFDTPYDNSVSTVYQLIPGPRPSAGGNGGQLTNNALDQKVFAFDKEYDRRKPIFYKMIPGPRPSAGGNGGQLTNNALGRPTTTVRPQPPRTTSSSNSPVTTTTPKPVIQHNSDDEFDWSTLGLSPDASIGSRLGINDNTLNPMRREPSKCTWAIANCCSQFSDKIRYYCFEQNQCFGAFWGDNVCRGYYRLALDEIENYYRNA